jgi:hypothetical protein
MATPVDDVQNAVRTLVRVTGSLAQFCDRAEHNEGTDRAIVSAAGEALRGCALSLLRARAVDPVAAYAERLASMEARHPLGGAGVFDADEQIPLAKTWRDLQRFQAQHDAVYHPDVCGLAKIEQLRHYTLHLAKLAWMLQDHALEQKPLVAPERDRFVDILVFGVKLATVCGSLLPDELVEWQV